MGKQITIRGLSDETARRLQSASRERAPSVNTTVLEILEQAVGANERRRRLERHATWTAADEAEFDESLRAQRVIDDEIERITGLTVTVLGST